MIRALVTLTTAVAVATAAGQSARALDLMINVLNESSRAVDGLGLGDFDVEIDGRAVRVQRVAQKTQPVSITLVIDRTPSMSEAGALLMADRLAAVVMNGLQAADHVDTARLLTFGTGELFQSGPLPQSRKGIQRLLRVLDEREWEYAKRIRAGTPPTDIIGYRGSPLWDEVHRAIKAIAGDAARKIVVVVTDGRVTGSALGPEDLAERAVRAGVVVSFVHQGFAEWVHQDQAGKAAVRSDRALRWVADATGGTYFADATARAQPSQFNVPAAFVMRSIKHHRRPYILRLQDVAVDERPQSVKVTVKRPRLVVVAPASIIRGG